MSSNAGIKLLIAEDEKNLGLVLQKELSRMGHQVTLVHDAESAIRTARETDFDVALLDIMMPGRSGLEVLRELRGQEQPPEVLMMTGHATVETALQAMKLGAYDYLTKPCQLRELEAILNKAHEKRQLRRENLILQSRLTYKEKAPDIIIRSQKMIEIMSLVRKVATSNAMVLVTGESGTGKELIANTVHRFSQRFGGPFIDISCAAIQDTLLESELFGYEAGAFTGARKRKLGLLELAHGGTLFLDEIGEMSLTLQSKLLRVLETQSFYRVGGTKKVEVDVRFIAATNRELSSYVAEGKFRSDLLFRINNFTIKLPPLRERPEDIPSLAAHFLALVSGGNHMRMSEEAMQVLQEYHWPGNVRELRNVIERAVILASDNQIFPEDLPLELRTHRAAAQAADEGEDVNSGSLDELRRKQILTVLEQTGWHQGRASEILGISPSTLYRQLKSYGLTRSRRMPEVTMAD
ncbi:MAG TPA: sigma-54 dependent transcriptional regulator [Blastocatellia bacterium]|jgi:DNA-binding NtrC family response regulator|nr:sigma-54 dependent transcriptional regulator [Blastocatellia bacterium]